MLLEIKDGTVSRGGNEILKNFDFYIKGREKAALVGRNGCGKTTLLNVLAGAIPLDRDDRALSNGKGRLVFSRDDIKIAFLRQDFDLPPLSVSEYLDLSAEKAGEDKAGALLDGQSLLTSLGFSRESFAKKPSDLSGGEKKKLMLASLIMEKPDLLLLDEPTNHLDFESVRFLEKYIKSLPCAVLTVSHDRWFLDQISEFVWEIDDRKLTVFPGSYSASRASKKAARDRDLKRYKAALEEAGHEKDLIRKFKGKSGKAAFIRAREKKLEKIESLKKPVDSVIRTEPLIPLSPGSRNVILAEDLAAGYDFPLLKINLKVRRGKKICLLGPNGSGKTTLLKILAGITPPLKGKVIRGSGITCGYFDQLSAEISSEKSVIQYFRDLFPSARESDLRNELAVFLFRGQECETRVSDLSGGEKSRLVLASIIMKRPNLLILDEPTNNMDIASRESLESIFSQYKGTIIFASHDRYFINKTADSLIILKKESQDALFYPFSYSHYEEMLEKSDGEKNNLRSSEEEKLIEGLRAVPRASHLPGSLSGESEILDYEYRMNREKQEKSLQKLKNYIKDDDYSGPVYNSVEEYLNSDDEESEEEKAKKEAAEKEWTESLIEWYDIYKESNP